MSSQPAQFKSNSSTPSSGPQAQLSALEGMLAVLRVRHSRPASALAAHVGSALAALWANRLRSFLTILGIFIGVASVIAALTLTQGADAYINAQINSIGTTIAVSSGAGFKGGVAQGGGSLSTLTLQDAQTLAQLAHVTNVSPLILINEQVVSQSRPLNTQIEGVEENFQSIQQLQLAQGSWFSFLDDSSRAQVAVLGNAAAGLLFGSSNPLGHQIRIGGQEFRVIGVTAMQGSFGVDTSVYVPLSTAQIRLKNTPNIDQIFVQVDTISNVNQVAQNITAQLRQNHRLSANRADNFAVTTFIQFLGQANQSNQILFYLLVGIAAISLTVGGVGIMNIMLVSVTERTWEIGIRMSIGARRRDIRNQFLIEALLLCLFGGAIGLLLGLLIGNILTSSFGIPFVITPVTLILPFTVSAAIALVFGLYPAIRAARLDPILALRLDE